MFMPRRPLPKVVVDKLRRYIEAQHIASRELGYSEHYLTTEEMKQLENIDHRRNRVGFNQDNPNDFGGRVRLVKSNGVAGDIVLKKAHTGDAITEIRVLKERVREHNKRHANNSYYVLHMPYAYPVGRKFIVMSKIRNPIQVNDILSRRDLGKGVAESLIQNKLYRYFVSSANEIIRGLGLTANNVLYLGYKQGKFHFIPLIDLE